MTPSPQQIAALRAQSRRAYSCRDCIARRDRLTTDARQPIEIIRTVNYAPQAWSCAQHVRSA